MPEQKLLDNRFAENDNIDEALIDAKTFEDTPCTIHGKSSVFPIFNKRRRCNDAEFV